MKTTDIPNGYVVLGPGGRNILVDFDDKGKAMVTALEVSITGWPTSIMMNGRMLPDILVLVHSVKGEKEMLIKRLAARQMRMDGNPITIAEVAKKGVLSHMAEDIWKNYMDGKKSEEEGVKSEGGAHGKV